MDCDLDEGLWHPENARETIQYFRLDCRVSCPRQTLISQ